MDWVTTSTILGDLRNFENRAAWVRFVNRFRKPVVRFACRIGVPEWEAEDVAQETLVAFANAYRGGSYDRGKGRLSGWLFGIAYNQILRHRRAANRLPHKGESSFLRNVPDEASASTLWDHEWEQSLLQNCLERASCEFESTTFRAFEMVVRDDRPPGETAELLGIPIKAVYNAKHRVLKRVRELRSEYEEMMEKT
ncbi:MAG: RNA polymerase sigma factor [Phycisphaerae bacterium]|jgi:RNA polymerase sigma-70 factor (ECF subfamily)